MKFSSKQAPFKPFDFTITVESENDADLLAMIFNMSERNIENQHEINLNNEQKDLHLELYREYSKLYRPNKSAIVETDDLIPAANVLPDNTPGKRLRGLRFRDNLRQSDIATYLNVRIDHVREMERGKCKISDKHARKLAKLFNIGVEVFK